MTGKPLPPSRIHRPWALAASLAFSLSAGLMATAGAAPADAPPELRMQQQIEAMQAEIAALQARLEALQSELRDAVVSTQPGVPVAPAPTHEQIALSVDAPEAEAPDSALLADTGISLGGAVRFQYSHESYNPDNKRRNGDVDFDIFRLDLKGRIGGVSLDAQWRWFQYMSAMQHAWVAYDFNEASQLQVGLTRIPFGNQPYNSHSYFFSSNYYLGLEDSHAMGVEYIHDAEPWNLQLAFFKNDGMGGVDGYVSDRTASYSYNVLGVRGPGEGIYDDPAHPAAAVDTLAARVARQFRLGPWQVEAGISGRRGDLRDAGSRIGDYSAWALHANADWQRWNLQAQLGRYDYDVLGGAPVLAVGAYGFYDSIAARADSYSLNLAYHLPLRWGPVTGVDFYNDHSLITRKSGGLPSTRMNVLGAGFSAGALYTYLDYVIARNQPFIGGSMAGDGGTEHRLNLNFGYYF